MTQTRFVSHSKEETQGFAAKLALEIEPPAVIALSGDLGAGKTTFVRAFVRALRFGDKVRVKSPSFALHHEYATSPICHHLDLYRLSDTRHFEDLGLRELIDNPDGIVLIEWPELIMGQLPASTIKVRFEDLGGEGRSLILTR